MHANEEMNMRVIIMFIGYKFIFASMSKVCVIIIARKHFLIRVLRIRGGGGDGVAVLVVA